MITPNALLAALLGAALGGAILLLILGLRGSDPDTIKSGPSLGERITDLWNTYGGKRLGLGVAALVVVAVITRWPVLALAAGALVYLWPTMFGSGLEAAAAITRLEALATWTESLRDTVASSVGLTQAIPNTAQNAPPAIRPYLVRLAGRIRSHEPVADALLLMAAELKDSSAEKVVAALVANAKQQGPGLKSLLTALVISTREEIDLRREIEAGRKSIRRGSQFIAIFVSAFLGFLVVFARDFLNAYDSTTGQLVLVLVVATWAVSFAWMRSASSQAEPQRFLRVPDLTAPVSSPVQTQATVSAR